MTSSRRLAPLVAALLATACTSSARATSSEDPPAPPAPHVGHAAPESTAPPVAAPRNPATAIVPPSRAHPLVRAARAYLGRPYRFGARGEQLDCMGLVFLAWTDATGGPWRGLSVNPTELVAKRQLGSPVPGLDGVRTEAIPWDAFAPGDVVFFLGPMENAAEPALVAFDDGPRWVWHMGIYSGGPLRTFVVGDHFARRVAEPALPAYLQAHADWYDGVYVVRPPIAPAPAM